MGQALCVRVLVLPTMYAVYLLLCLVCISPAITVCSHARVPCLRGTSHWVNTRCTTVGLEELSDVYFCTTVGLEELSYFCTTVGLEELSDIDFSY